LFGPSLNRSSCRCSRKRPLWCAFGLRWPDLFGRALLVRQWGRIGTQGHRRLDPYPDCGAAINALAALLRAKRRRGYQDRGT
jgi:hypothetical protein